DDPGVAPHLLGHGLVERFLKADLSHGLLLSTWGPRHGPQTPRRSGRPGGAVASLDSPAAPTPRTCRPAGPWDRETDWRRRRPRPRRARTSPGRGWRVARPARAWRGRPCAAPDARRDRRPSTTRSPRRAASRAAVRRRSRESASDRSCTRAG